MAEPREAWRDTCERHVSRFRAGMRGERPKANPRVCEDMMNRWLDALAAELEREAALDEEER